VSGGARGLPASARARRLAEIGLLVTVLIWSANFVIVKASIGALGPFTFTGSRYLVAAVTLLLILWRRQGSVRPPAGLAALIGLGLIGFGGYQVLWTTGLTQISAGDSALLIAASPVLVALLAAAVGMDRLTAPKLAGALIAFAGVAVVIGGSQALSLGSSLVGDVLTLGAAVLWAVYTVGASRVVRRIDPLQATTWTVIGGACLLVPLGIAEAATRPPAEVTPAVLVAILYSGALAAGISNVFVINAIRSVGPTRATAMQFLVPAGAVVLGAVFLAEPVGLPQVIGGAVIVLGVWLTRRPSILPPTVRARLSSAA
jgi:drug/metabolite transporter (DMT)-like permease